MSVAISVGWLDEMRRCDGEGFARYKKFFAGVTTLLQAQGVPTYIEPEDLQGKRWGGQVFPSNGIAYLQRLAVYLWQKEEWPKPGTDDMGNPLADEEIELEYEDCYTDETSTNSSGQRFNHLVCHPCRDGYWLPVEFDTVIVDNKEQFGSSLALKRELEAIAALLKLPLDLNPRERKVEDMTRFGSRRSRTLWKKYGIEAFNCLLLYHAARASEALGAAIHLH